MASIFLNNFLEIIFTEIKKIFKAFFKHQRRKENYAVALYIFLSLIKIC